MFNELTWILPLDRARFSMAEESKTQRVPLPAEQIGEYRSSANQLKEEGKLAEAVAALEDLLKKLDRKQKSEKLETLKEIIALQQAMFEALKAAEG